MNREERIESKGYAVAVLGKNIVSATKNGKVFYAESITQLYQNIIGYENNKKHSKLAKDIQRKVDVLTSMSDAEGSVTINIEIPAKTYEELDAIMDEIDAYVSIKPSTIRVKLFYIWKKK